MRMAGYEMQRFLRRVALANPGIPWQGAFFLLTWANRCSP
jgi:hypothetical protein